MSKLITDFGSAIGTTRGKQVRVGGYFFTAFEPGASEAFDLL